MRRIVFAEGGENAATGLNLGDSATSVEVLVVGLVAIVAFDDADADTDTDTTVPDACLIPRLPWQCGHTRTVVTCYSFTTTATAWAQR